MLKEIRSSETAGRPIKPEFSTRLLVLLSGKDQKVFMMSGTDKQTLLFLFPLQLC